MAAVTLTARFLPGPAGPLAATIVAPERAEPRFGVLYVPPFGEEMNKARRMAALQARALASAGGIVALLDLRGTGDSAGDHGGATWEGWRDDVACAWSWLVGQTGGPCLLWGLRLGALLAAETAAKGRVAPAALLLWQPVVSGQAYFGQVLRLATIQGRLSADDTGGRDAKALRAALASNEAVEVAGYELGPALVAGAEAASLAAMGDPGCPVIWRDIVTDASGALSPATQRIAARWKGDGVALDVAAVSGSQFWATQEIAEAPDLVQATTAVVVGLVQGSVRLPA